MTTQPGHERIEVVRDAPEFLDYSVVETLTLAHGRKLKQPGPTFVKTNRHIFVPFRMLAFWFDRTHNTHYRLDEKSYNKIVAYRGLQPDPYLPTDAGSDWQARRGTVDSVDSRNKCYRRKSHWRSYDSVDETRANRRSWRVSDHTSSNATTSDLPSTPFVSTQDSDQNAEIGTGPQSLKISGSPAINVTTDEPRQTSAKSVHRPVGIDQSQTRRASWRAQSLNNIDTTGTDKNKLPRRYGRSLTQSASEYTTSYEIQSRKKTWSKTTDDSKKLEGPWRK